MVQGSGDIFSGNIVRAIERLLTPEGFLRQADEKEYISLNTLRFRTDYAEGRHSHHHGDWVAYKKGSYVDMSYKGMELYFMLAEQSGSEGLSVFRVPEADESIDAAVKEAIHQMTSARG